MPPINDNLANAITLTVPQTISGDNTGATLEATEIANNWEEGTGDVWYKWTATFTGNLKITLLAPTIDQEYDILSGTDYTNFSYVSGNYSSAGTTTDIIIQVTQGITYFFQITYFSPNLGGAFTLGLEQAFTPSNDNFTQAQSITSVSFPISDDNTLATTEVGEKTAHYNSMWYSFSAVSDGTLHLTIDNSFRIAVYTGSILTELSSVTALTGSNNNITVPISAYLNYKIVIYSASIFSYGQFTLTGAFTAITHQTNDYFSNNIELTGNTFTVSANNSLATKQIYEDGTNYFSLWYSYTPTESGTFTIAQTSGIALNFKIYVGTTMANLVPVTSSNDSISLAVQENVTYYIAVSSQNSTTYGSFTFNGIFANELPFQYSAGAHGLSQAFSERCCVRESGGRVWVGKVNNGVGVSLSYSDDNGTTWNTNNYADTDVNSNQEVSWTGLFFDSSENLIFGYTTDTLARNFRMIKQAKVGFATTVYDNTVQGGTGASLPSFSPYVHACQDDSGYIHVLRTVLTNYAYGVSAIEGAYNLYHFSFKDGVFSAEEQLTSYSGYAYSDYQDNVLGPFENIYDGGIGNHWQFPRIIFHANQLLVFWSTLKYVYTGVDSEGHAIGTTTRQVLYSVKSTYTDLIAAAHPWITSRAYKIGYAVLQGGNYYVCNTAHTAGVFSTDLNKWTLINSGSIVTPTIFFSGVILNNIPYQVGTANRFGIQSIRSNDTHLYFIFIINYYSGSSITYYLYEDYVDITPYDGEWGDWMWPNHFDLAQNDDLILHGLDKRIFGDSPTSVARRGGVWEPEHTDSRNYLYAGHTYNFAKIQ